MTSPFNVKRAYRIGNRLDRFPRVVSVELRDLEVDKMFSLTENVTD